MQKFKFKLDGLLKVREFKEKKIKIELGEILKEVGEVEGKIAFANKAIDETYEAQEAFMQDLSSGNMLQFFPVFIQGKKEDIKNKNFDEGLDKEILVFKTDYKVWAKLKIYYY